MLNNCEGLCPVHDTAQTNFLGHIPMVQNMADFTGELQTLAVIVSWVM